MIRKLAVQDRATTVEEDIHIVESVQRGLKAAAIGLARSSSIPIAASILSIRCAFCNNGCARPSMPEIKAYWRELYRRLLDRRGAGRLTADDPATGEMLAEQALGDAGDVHRAVEAARACHDLGRAGRQCVR